LARLLRVPYDSTNCIRFSGYALSSALLTEHPNRNDLFVSLHRKFIKGFLSESVLDFSAAAVLKGGDPRRQVEQVFTAEGKTAADL